MNREEEINNAGHTQYGKYAGGTSLECFKYGAAWADEHPKNPWISIKDRLPEEGVRVFTAGGIRSYDILLYHASKFYQSLSQGLYDGSVTHWMPIPELNV